jgi:S1-C subfamily serine protease
MLRAQVSHASHHLWLRPNDRWKLEGADGGQVPPGHREAMQLSAGGQVLYSGHIVFRSNTFGYLSPNLSTAQLRQASRGDVLQFLSGGQSYDYNVQGMPTVIAEVQRCLQRLASGGRVPSGKGERIFTGSGFFVSTMGHILTNAHVVDGCSSVSISGPARPPESVPVLAVDTKNDLALLRSSGRPQSAAPIRSAVRMGEGVAAYGFPLSALLPSSGNFTVGNVTATAGLRDDPRQLQISNPVQQGNSGGPLLDMRGNIVGIVASKLNVLAVARLTQDLPQNVNFAIKADIALQFLQANGVSPVQEVPSAQNLDPADLAAAAMALSRHVRCTPTPDKSQ